MDTSEFPVIVCLVVCLAAGCSAIAGWIAHEKRRSPMEGVLLGLVLGPIGILVECWYPYARRPLVDKNARDSLQSMMTHQGSGREPDGLTDSPQAPGAGPGPASRRSIRPRFRGK